MIIKQFKMYIRRFYRKGIELPHTFSDLYFEHLVQEKGLDEALWIDNAQYELVFQDRKERNEYFFNSCQRVINNPRYYLDNLDNIPEIGNGRVYSGQISCFTTLGTLKECQNRKVYKG